MPMRQKISVCLRAGHHYDPYRLQGLGYRICDDSIREMIKASGKYGIFLPTGNCAARPFRLMRSKISFRHGRRCKLCLANRQMITHCSGKPLKASSDKARANSGFLVYDVCQHCKDRKHTVNKKTAEVWFTEKALPGRLHPVIRQCHHGINQLASQSLFPEIWAGPLMCSAEPKKQWRKPSAVPVMAPEGL